MLHRDRNPMRRRERAASSEPRDGGYETLDLSPGELADLLRQARRLVAEDQSGEVGWREPRSSSFRP
jgi:hypothetical protein